MDKVKGFTSVSNGFMVMNYYVSNKRGLYITGGMGYGVRAKIKDSTFDMAYIASVIFNKTPQELMVDQNFNNAMNNVSNNTNDLVKLINQIAPNNDELVSQIDTREKIQNTLSDEDALNQFVNDA